MQVMKCHSVLPSRTYCYARVLQDMCGTSAADINLLKTILYDAKLSRVVQTSCALGESQYVFYFSIWGGPKKLD